MPTPRRPAARASRGVTLVELLVALTVLSVALLALAGVTANVLGAASSAARGGRAAEWLGARAEALQAAPCDTASGTRVADGLREAWRVRRDARLLVLADTVAWDARARRTSAGITAWRWCGR